MPNVICAVVGCSNSTYRLKKWKKETCLGHHGFHECCGCPRPFHLFCFPSELQNNDQRQLWIQAMKRDNVKGNPWKPGKSTSQFPLNPYAKTFAARTLSIRMNVGRKGTSYLQRIETYLPFSDPKKLPYLRQSAGCLIQRLNPNAISFIPKLNLPIKKNFSKENLGRDGSLYNISACDVPYEMNKCVVNTEIHAFDPNAKTFVPRNYPIHQNYLLIFITSALMIFTFLIILFLLLIFGDIW